MQPKVVPPALQEIFQEVFFVDTLEWEDTPRSISEWDSQGHLHLVEVLKKRFHLENFSDQEFNQMESVAAIVHILENRGVLFS
jgi:acyl carrier protein